MTARKIEVTTVSDWRQWASWIIVILYFLFMVGSFYVQALWLMMFPLGVFFALFHAAQKYNWSGAILFLVICFCTGMAYENLSIATGFPFGFYNWTKSGSPGPWIGTLPVLTGIAYCGTGYVSWELSNLLLSNNADKKRNRFITPLIAAFIMVMWDMGMDPMASTAQHAWIWHNGGGFFGVPISNFLGWYLVNWSIYQIFSVVISLRRSEINVVHSKRFYLAAILLYLLIAVNDHIPLSLIHSQKILTDATGKTWILGDLFETLLIVTIFSMGFVIVLSLVKVFQIND